MEPSIIEEIRRSAGSDRYAAYLRNTLMDLLAIDTTPGQDPEETARREQELFNWIVREIGEMPGHRVRIERPAINPAIAGEAEYGPPIYAAGAEGNNPPAEHTYKGRSNLQAIFEGESADGALGVIGHANVDTAGPWAPGRSVGERVYGRGACNNKGHVALLLAQMKLFHELEKRLGRRAARGRVYQFVIDGSWGGAGSLSAVLDTRFAGVPLLMYKCTGLVPYGGQCGLLEYHCRLSTGNTEAVTAVEMFPAVIEALEAESQRLRAESKHPLFTAEQVFSNHGILGVYGESAEQPCPRAAFEIIAKARANPQRVGMKIMEFLDAAVAEYTKKYGDKTRTASTDQPRIARHFDLQIMPTTDTQRFRLDVWGCRGSDQPGDHGDSAITKATYLLGALLRVAGNFPGVQAWGRLADETGDDRRITLRGVQSYTPAHSPAEVADRLGAAAEQGLRQYCRLRGRRYDPNMLEMNCRRRHGEAFAGAPDAAAMPALQAAFNTLGEPWPEARGRTCPSEADIYHRRNHPVVIFGAGRGANAGANEECVDVPQLQKALAISTLAAWIMSA